MCLWILSRGTIYNSWDDLDKFVILRNIELYILNEQIISYMNDILKFFSGAGDRTQGLAHAKQMLSV
jgi:hypothetical protein